MRRAAEAVTVRTFINGEMKAAPAVHTIVLGDFNDEPLAATSQIFLGPADADIKSTDQGDPVRLYNLVDSIPLRGIGTKDFLAEAERFSRIHEGKGELIDHIVVCKGLVFVGTDFIVKEVRSFVGLIGGQSVTQTQTSVPRVSHLTMPRYWLALSCRHDAYGFDSVPGLLGQFKTTAHKGFSLSASKSSSP